MALTSDLDEQLDTAWDSCARSGYRGVYWSPTAQKWLVQIRFRGRCLHVGYYVDIELAAAAYDEAVVRVCESLKLNFGIGPALARISRGATAIRSPTFLGRFPM